MADNNIRTHYYFLETSDSVRSTILRITIKRLDRIDYPTCIHIVYRGHHARRTMNSTAFYVFKRFKFAGDIADDEETPQIKFAFLVSHNDILLYETHRIRLFCPATII